MARFCIYSLAAASFLILIIQNTFLTSEAKKLIKLKDLKKAKKYGYLLATQRKKFYAIPVPFPLPVIVKRQQIYTQVPIVPRYVQQPAQYQQYSSAPIADHNDPYASAMSSPQYQSESSQVDYQPQPSYRRVKYGTSMSSYGGSGGGKPSYFATLANVLGQAYPALVGNAAQNVVSGNVVGKLLSGQAKVYPPSQFKSLLFNSKSPSSAHKLSKEPEEEQEPEGKHHGGKEASSSSGNTTTTSGRDSDKPSASETIYSSLHNPYGPYHTRPARPHHHQFYGRPSYYAPAYHQLGQYSYAYPPAGLVPTLVASPSTIPYQNMAEMIEQQHQQQQQLQQQQLELPASGLTAEGMAAEPSNLGQQLELLQPQESLDSPQAAVSESGEGGKATTEESKLLRQQALKAALIRHRLAEMQLAEENSAEFELAASQLGLS